MNVRYPSSADDSSAIVGRSAGPAAGAQWDASVCFPEYQATVPSLLRYAMAQYPDNLAVATPDQRLTYGDLDRQSSALAARLVAIGVGKGSRVGTLLPNGAGWVVAWAAITRIGAISTPVNTFYKTPELATMLRHADVQVLIAISGLGPHDYVGRLLDIAPGLASASAPTPLLLPELPQLRQILFWDNPDAEWATTGLGTSLVEAPTPELMSIVTAMEDDVTPTDPMLITYTSGSTGEPKGVVHGNGPLLRHAHNLAAMSGIGPTDRIWTPMPLCWVGGFAFTLLRAFSVGGAFVTQERMDAGVALGLLERERVSCVSAWPSIGATLMAHPDYPSTDLSALRLGTFYEGRSPEHRPADPGLGVTSLGMSETGGPHTFWTLEDDLTGTTESYRGTFGHEVPGVSHRVVDSEGNDVDEGVTGEVLVRGYSVMLGLYKRERSETFDSDGWLHTGDRGYFRDGWFFFAGRQGDLIKTKGANVSPSEIEKVIAVQADIGLAFVFGVDDPDRGQDVVALITLNGEDAKATIDELRVALHSELSSYKLPRHIFAIDQADVPYLTSQKPDRLSLARLATELASDAETG